MGYAIACGHEVTAQAAEEILRNGGNVIDAAIAAFAASWVAEPCMSGPGGGAFATIRFDNKFFALDCFANTPSVKKSMEMVTYVPINVDFGDTTELFYAGQGSIAVPGAIDGIFKIHELGGSIPIKELFYSAIENAKKGVVLNEFQHYDLQLLQDILGLSERGRELFFENTDIKSVGTNIMMPQLADFLDYLSIEGRNAFYQGEVASRIALASEENGGHISLHDLKNYQSQISKTLSCKYCDSDIHTNGIPSVGGTMLIRLLQILNEEKAYSHNGLVHALKKLDSLKTRGEFERPKPHNGGLKKGGTSHISIIDKNHNAISLSMSLGEGSGYFVPGTDIHLNNMLGEESLLPDGIHSWIEDARMSSMMSPTLIIDEKENSIASIGSGGASRIPMMIGQFIYHFLSGQKSITEAMKHPRIHLSGDLWQSEPGFQRPAHIPNDKWIEWKKQSLYFGGTHCAAASNHFIAVGDSRRTGVGLVG